MPQLNDVSTKYINKFSSVFTPVITDEYNNCVAFGIFPECFKTAEVNPIFNNDKFTEKTNGRWLSILSNPVYLKFMKDLCMIIWVITLMMFYQNFSAVIYDRDYTKNL